MRTLPCFPPCPVCGDPTVNPTTLGMRWVWDGEAERVLGVFRPGNHHVGYEGQMHGGLLPALFDECLAWACAVRAGSYCVTGELGVRFKAPIPLHQPVTVLGRSGDAWGPYVKASGEARSAAGALLASASAVFRALPREASMRLRDALTFAPDDWDILAGGA
jgi:acyl-coenzyme A thioesterase PaaI-like protein